METANKLHNLITGSIIIDKSKIAESHIATRFDLIDNYLGRTSIKTQKFIDSCKDKTIFIDAYFGDPENSFEKECIETLNKNIAINGVNNVNIFIVQ